MIIAYNKILKGGKDISKKSEGEKTKRSMGRREAREEKIRLSMARLKDYDRAMIASRLVLDDKFYMATEKAVKEKDEEMFKDTCKKAKIPEDLANHMWKIVDASWETVYSKQNPNPFW
jgi:hypothetical protein